MAQSYGTLTTSTIYAAVDEIMGVDINTQNYGTSLSKLGAEETIVTGLTLSIALDGGAPVVIALTAHDNAYDIAAEIQTLVRAAGAGVEYTAFIARWDSSIDKYVLISGTSGASPAVLASRVAVTGGTAAALLLLGLAQGGTESYAALPYIEYTVRYRFVYEAGKNFGSSPVLIVSTDMVLATDVSEAVTLANAVASQLKATWTPTASTISTDSENGPVVL